MHFVLYLKKNLKKEIKKILSEIFHVSMSDVSELLEYENTIFKYEIIDLSNIKLGFYSEVNVYCQSNLKNKDITNNLSLALKLAPILDDEILINDESYNPYQWILVKNGKHIFLVEAKEHSEESILIDKWIGELDLKKALKLLSGYIAKSDKKAFYIESPSMWTNILIN